MSGTGTIYIVDDQLANRDILDTILTARGYLTRTFADGPGVLDAARLEPPDLFLLDIMMPRMNGLEVCQWLKQDPDLRDIPVIFISALEQASDKVRAFAAGGADYITKPFHQDEIAARVENQITVRRQQRELSDQLRQIQRLQSILKSFLSTSAWESIEADFMAAEFKYEPQFEIMTVLITDIAGFSKVSERVEPNTVIATLSLYMNMLSRIVYQFNGEVDKYLGDGMFAFFRQPSEAVEAARRIQRRVEQFNVQQSARGMMQFPTRIGIATGKVLLALIGSTSRREYTLIGDRVNVAARLQELAPVGGIAIDEVTYQAASTPAYVASDTFVLKGKEKLERVYLLKLES